MYDRGILHFYFNRKQTEHALDVNKLYKKAGLKIRITHEELYTLEPSLMGKKFDSTFTKSDKSGDTHRFCNNLVAKLLDENKVKLINKEVTDLRKELKEDDKIFLCASVGSRKLAKSIGEFLNISCKRIFYNCK